MFYYFVIFYKYWYVFDFLVFDFYFSFTIFLQYSHGQTSTESFSFFLTNQLWKIILFSFFSLLFFFFRFFRFFFDFFGFVGIAFQKPLPWFYSPSLIIFLKPSSHWFLFYSIFNSTSLLLFNINSIVSDPDLDIYFLFAVFLICFCCVLMRSLIWSWIYFSLLSFFFIFFHNLSRSMLNILYLLGLIWILHVDINIFIY